MLYPMETIKTDKTPAVKKPPPAPPDTAIVAPWLRWPLIALGWLLVGIGIVGIFVPGLPTTVFLIGALWAFSRSSKRFQAWLWTHPLLGGPVRDWELHGVIPVRAKVIAAIVMSLSFVYVAIWVAEDWKLPAGLGIVMMSALIYISTRPSRPPTPTDND